MQAAHVLGCVILGLFQDIVLKTKILDLEANSGQYAVIVFKEIQLSIFNCSLGRISWLNNLENKIKMIAVSKKL